MIRAKIGLEKFHPKPSEAVFSTVFFAIDLWIHSEVDNDVICGVAVDYVGMGVHVKLEFGLKVVSSH